MKAIKLTNIDIKIFKDAFSNFKRFVSSDFEFNFENCELSTSLDDFDKWHLVTLATFYGRDLFRKKNEIVIEGFQFVNISFKVDYNLPKVKFKSKWGDIVELNPAYLYSAELFLTDRLIKMLSENSKLILKENISDFEQSVFLDSKKYAYFMTNKTLVLIQTEGDNAKITHLFKIRWNEI
ncbi:hypothetical protein KRX57_09745 [Weeksellaceae bacterium TAE3-ERU29]|nr:hypothetical protein [Weeksellaceae bacterium TAE3-ERU29]